MPMNRAVSAAIKMPVRIRLTIRCAPVGLVVWFAAPHVGSGDAAKKAAGISEKNEETRKLPPEAQRALAEADERRRKALEREKTAAPKPKEIGGPEGPEPPRYGDGELKGIRSDFCVS